MQKEVGSLNRGRLGAMGWGVGGRLEVMLEACRKMSPNQERCRVVLSTTASSEPFHES